METSRDAFRDQLKKTENSRKVFVARVIQRKFDKLFLIIQNKFVKSTYWDLLKILTTVIIKGSTMSLLSFLKMDTTNLKLLKAKVIYFKTIT